MIAVMTTAIVTITCPSCGGKIEGITATNADQTIKCTYCGTELHVPRVGEVVREIVHEVVREVPSEPVYIDTAVPDLRKKQSPVFALVALGVGTCILVPMLCYQGHQADHMIDDFKKEDEARDTCKANCKSSCGGAAKDRGSDWDPELAKTMADADRQMCETQCEIDKDCYQVNKYLKKP